MQPIAVNKSSKGVTRTVKVLIPGAGGSQVSRVISDGLRGKQSVDVTTSAGAFRVRRTQSGRFDIYAF